MESPTGAGHFDFTIEKMQRAQLAPFDLHPDDMVATGIWTDRHERRYGATLEEGYRFRTPSGKIELASERFRRRGLDPIPSYAPREQIPQGQFRLLVGKCAIYTHASNQNNPWLHELAPEKKTAALIPIRRRRSTA